MRQQTKRPCAEIRCRLALQGPEALTHTRLVRQPPGLSLVKRPSVFLTHWPGLLVFSIDVVRWLRARPRSHRLKSVWTEVGVFILCVQACKQTRGVGLGFHYVVPAQRCQAQDAQRARTAVSAQLNALLKATTSLPAHATKYVLLCTGRRGGSMVCWRRRRITSCALMISTRRRRRCAACAARPRSATPTSSTLPCRGPRRDRVCTQRGALRLRFVQPLIWLLLPLRLYTYVNRVKLSRIPCSASAQLHGGE